MKMICLDMDGTIADLYNYENWLTALQNEDPSPYIYAEPLVDMDRLREVLLKLSDKGYQVRVISWLSKDSSELFKAKVRCAKRNWLEKYNLPLDAIHLVAYGTTKANCVRRYNSPAILIDDNQKILNGWTLGETIDASNPNWIEELENLVGE